MTRLPVFFYEHIVIWNMNMVKILRLFRQAKIISGSECASKFLSDDPTTLPTFVIVMQSFSLYRPI